MSSQSLPEKLMLPATLAPPLLLALRLAPLVGSTASLTHAYMEWVTTSAFINPPALEKRVSRRAAPPAITNKDVIEEIAEELAQESQLASPAPTGSAGETDASVSSSGVIVGHQDLQSSTQTPEEPKGRAEYETLANEIRAQLQSRPQTQPTTTLASSTTTLLSPVAAPIAQDFKTRVRARIHDAALDRAIPHWFTNFFNRGLWSVVGLNSLTTSTALANLFLYPAGLAAGRALGLGAHRKWYLAGLGAALAHYAFVPGVMRSVQALVQKCWVQNRGKDEVLDGIVGRKEDRVAGRRGPRGAAERSARELLGEWLGVHRVRMCTVDVVALGCFAVGAVSVLADSFV